MAKKTSSIAVRLEPETKAEAERILAAYGLSVSSAVQMFIAQLVRKRKLPLDLNEPVEPD